MRLAWLTAEGRRCGELRRPWRAGRQEPLKNCETRRVCSGVSKTLVFPDREWRGLLEGVGQGLYSLFYGPLLPDRLCPLLL